MGTCFRVRRSVAVGFIVLFVLWAGISNFVVVAQHGTPDDTGQPLPLLFLPPPADGIIDNIPPGGTIVPAMQPLPLGVLRQRVVLLNAPLLAADSAGGTISGESDGGDEGKEFLLNFFADVEQAVSLHRQADALVTSDLTRELWIGEIVGAELSSALFLVREERVTANIRSPQGFFTVRPLPNGLHLIREIDATQFSRAPDDGRSLPLIAPDVTGSSSVTATDPDAVTGASITTDDGSVVDVMVAYSAAARVAVGDTETMLERIALVIDETNLSYANSQINTRLRLVHAQETAYNTAGMGRDLERLTATGDGIMDDLHTLRNTHGADLVSLWVEGGDYCGIAWINATAEYAFSVIDRWCAENTVTFAHELGHNFGARHDWYADDTIDAPVYNKGHVDLTGRWISVMAYFNKCMAAGLSCREILHFSNPNITYNSRPTGVRQGTSTACTKNNLNNPDCDAENYRIHNDRAAVVANFRQNRDTAELTISNVDLVDPVNAGDEIIYQITVRNSGKRAAEAVQLLDSLPQGVIFVRTTQPTRCSHTSGIVRCDLGTVAADTSVGVNLTVQTNATTPARIFNNARVTTSTTESDTTNNSDSEGTTVQPVLVEHNLIFMSSTTNGWIGPISFRDEDIIAFDRRTGAWTFIFDGSDVGATTDVNGFVWLPDGSLLLTFAQPTVVPVLGVVDDSDIIRFIPATLGETTGGTFTWYLDGSDVGLTTNAEDIDAIALSPAGNLVISTLGTARVDQWVAYDEDLLEFRASTLGETTVGTWHYYFDGSDVGLGVNSEDIAGSWIDPGNGDLYVSTLGSFAVSGLAGVGSDIFFCTPIQLGEESRCDFTSFWRSVDHQFELEVVDGLALGTLPPLFRHGGESIQSAGTVTIEAAANLLDNEIDESESDNVAADNEVAAAPDERRQIFLPLISR